MLTRVSRARVLALLVLLAIWLAPVSVALANAMPILFLWLDFVYETAERPELEGVQLLSCNTAECSQPTLLLQYGTCDSKGCLDLSPVIEAWQPMECLGARCVAAFNPYDFAALPPFKVIGDFSDRVRESALLGDPLPSWGDAGWQIAVQDTTLVISDSDPRLYKPDKVNFGGFFQTFALTIIVEMLAVAAAFGGWLKLRRRSLLNGLGYVLLINLVSYPVSWIFWPSLGRFQPAGIRATGIFVAIGAIVFAALLVIVSLTEGKPRRIWLVLTLVLLPLWAIATLSCLLITGLGAPAIAVAGLPSGLIIAFTELFAVSFEAFLLYLLARKTLALSVRQAVLISLLTNVSSFLASLALSSWL